MENETKPSKQQKKLITQFTADNVDITAPVKKILDDIQFKNPKAYNFYRQNVKQRCRTQRTFTNHHFVVAGHPLNAFDEDWDGELNLEYFEPFPYRSNPPKMISSLKNIQEKDPVTSLMFKKLHWHNFCFKLTSKIKDESKKYEKLNDDVVECSKQMVDIAAHLDSDPDPYFEESYNWYYAGNGNLQLICIDWIDYLLHSEFTTIHLSEFSKHTLYINPEPVAQFDCGKGNHILETICSSHNIIVLRTKYKMFILKLIKSGDETTFERLKCIGSELPYISVTFDSFHKNILYITTLDNKLNIVNLDRLKGRNVKLKSKLTSLINNWHTVIGSGRGYYTHVGGNVISIYDKRSNNVLRAWNGLRGITDYVSCNDISVAKHLDDSNSIYFGTDHHLFLMDIRSLPSGGPKVIRRWMHGMECVPTFMNYCNFVPEKHLICLSSQWCKDMCVVPDYNDILIKDTDSGGVTIPYRPPSIIDTLHEAKQKLHYQNLYNPIDARLYTCITGNVIIDQDEKYDILMQNSFGDISCHRLFPEYMESFIEDDSAQNLRDWSASYVSEKKVYKVSSVKNIASLLMNLRKVPDDFRIEAGFREEKCEFDEQEIVNAFENEEIDIGLQEVWVQASNKTDVNESTALHLEYSEED